MGGQASTTKTRCYLLEFKCKWWLADNEADLFLQTPVGPMEMERLPLSEA